MWAINFFPWIGLINVIAFWGFVLCGEELKLKNFEN